jgi:peptidoglycan/LPS O-acetylase OafA/YrhL
VLMVIAHHFLHFRPGWAGVDLFFAISGFLITRILLRTKESPHYFGNFYAKRVLRILPLYYFSLLVFFLVVFPLGARYGAFPQYGWADFFWFFFHLSNWWIGSGHMTGSPIAHYWSLAIEEQYYLVWPVVVFLFDRRTLAWIAGGAAALSLLSRGIATLLHPEMTGFFYFCTPFRIETIALGSLMAILAQTPALWQRVTGWRKNLMLAGYVLLAVLTFVNNSRVTVVFGLSVVGIVAVGMLLQAIGGNSPFDTAFFRHVGKYSYALYVIHYPICLAGEYVFRGQDPVLQTTLTALLGIPSSYLLSRASWVLIESPFLAIKSRFADQFATS